MLCLACLPALLALPGTAMAAIEVESFSLGESTTQAGAHPDLNLDFSFEEPGEPETAKDAFVQLPPGFWLYAGNMPRCTESQFASSECPVDAQVGLVTVHGNALGDPNFDLGTEALYLLSAHGGELTRFGFNIPVGNASVEVPVKLLPWAGYSSTLLFSGLPETTPIKSIEFEVWGVPAAPVHDEERFPIVSGGRPSGQPQLPFTRNPTACGTLTSAITATSYEDPDHPSTTETSGPAITGCSKPNFNPSLNVALSSSETSTTTGLDVEALNFQELDPDGVSSSDLESIDLFLPGLQVNKGIAATHSVCTLAQAHLTDFSPNECPIDSKLGSLAVAVAGIEDPIDGDIYFGGPESDEEYRLFLVAASAGIELKLPAWLSADGEVELALPGLPQLPLEKLDLQVEPSTSLFTTPPECGGFEALGEVTSWSELSVAFVLLSEFTIDSGPGGGPCPQPGAGGPGATQPTSGGSSPSPSPPPPLAQKPVVKILRHPPHRGHDRRPTFRFSSSVAGSAFECRIDRRPWRPCRSPLTLHKLLPGSHTFRVRAVGPAGTESRAAAYRFIVRP
jgi:hypothetical protein